MLDEINEKQEELMEKIASEYDLRVHSGDDSYDTEEIKKGIEFLYSLADLKYPEIVICNSPWEMAEDAGLEKGESFDDLGGGYDSGWTAFYDYFDQIGIKYDKDVDFDKWRDFITKSGVYATLLYEKMAFVCIRPCVVSRDEKDELHCEDGPAIAWRDGYGLFYLHGVSMSQEQVMTPAADMTAEMVMSEKNADVRAELVRKYGINRLADQGKVLDSYKAYSQQWWTKSEYELVDMAGIFESVDYAPHLKMKNQTTGIYHMEGVDPKCKSIADALTDRWGRNSNEYEIQEIK